MTKKKREQEGTTKDPIVQPKVDREIASVPGDASLRDVIKHYEARIKPILKKGEKLDANTARAFRLMLEMRKQRDISDAIKKQIFENYLDTWADSKIMKTKARDKESHRRWCTKPNKGQQKYRTEWNNYQRITLSGIRNRRKELINRYTKAEGHITKFQRGIDIKDWYCSPIKKARFVRSTRYINESTFISFFNNSNSFPCHTESLGNVMVG